MKQANVVLRVEKTGETFAAALSAQDSTYWSVTVGAICYSSRPLRRRIAPFHQVRLTTDSRFEARGQVDWTGTHPDGSLLVNGHFE